MFDDEFLFEQLRQAKDLEIHRSLSPDCVPIGVTAADALQQRRHDAMLYMFSVFNDIPFVFVKIFIKNQTTPSMFSISAYAKLTPTYSRACFSLRHAFQVITLLTPRLRYLRLSTF